jgi:uncharacterized protein (TIGR03435 family)
MSSALANHLWQSTLFAAAAWLLVLLLKKNQANARYWVWLVASVKFLIPFSVIIALGTFLAPPITVPAAQAGFSTAIKDVSQQFTAPAVSIPAIHPTENLVPIVLIALWLCGFLSVVVRWCVRWQRIRATVRAGRPLNMEADVPVLSSPALLEPGVFGVFRPVLLLPEGVTDHLTRAQFRAILAHELCHVRRRDNLFAAIHMLVEERERACDEEVLRLGSEPQVYAEGILKTCEFYLESPLACMSGVTGADLKKRVVRIMTQRVAKKLGRWRKLLLASCATGALAGPLAFGLMNPPRSQAEPQAHSAAPLAFEVASVKPNKSGSHHSSTQSHGGRVTATNVALEQYIKFAYNVASYQISGPDWLKSERYDITAEAPSSTSNDQLRLMLQTLLADRFKLALHSEEKMLPVYEVVIAKNGPKLRAAKSSGHGGFSSSPGHVSAQEESVTRFAELLSHLTERPVVDRTGLKGVYNFTLQWTPDMQPVPPEQVNKAATNDSGGPSLFTAVQEQLGLKLMPRKDPVEILVIDHVDKVPTAN